jgi:hypothetical protein
MPGESFQVQYILENAEKNPECSFPQFPGFRVVSGPNIYSGDKPATNNRRIQYKNFVFTLAALKEGEITIYGASCVVNGKILKSNNAVIKVRLPKESDESSYLLKPGEDPIKKIRENLFLKLTVDKQTCIMGEALVATFKLYSRLQSSSNIIKNPGFYGFSVYDMIDVGDKIQSQEKLNGRWFDVHTIRKLQLYPLEAGTFTIDAMEVANKVEFSRSMVTKKTEQEVSENMYGNKKDEHPANAEEFEMNVKSDPVIINVKPLPRRNPIDTFAGAVGNFSINAFIAKDTVLKNEEDSLTVEILGAGNFQRVAAPVVNWPPGIEFFDPSVRDSFDKEHVPITGQREFKYIFVSDRPGFYHIPSISFSFFDLQTKKYRTVSTKPFTIFISAKSKKDKLPIVSEVLPKSNHGSNGWIMWLLLLCPVILTGGILLWVKMKKDTSRARGQSPREHENPPISVDKILLPAKSALSGPDKIFYEELDRSIWNYFDARLDNFRDQRIKKQLINILISKGVQPAMADKLVEVINACETGIYTNAQMDLDKRKLFEDAQQILIAIEYAFGA